MGDEVREDVARLLIDDPERGRDGEILSGIIDEVYKNMPPANMSSAKFAGYYLITTRNQIVTARETAAFAAMNGIMWRGMFCRVVLEAQGRQHAAGERASYFREESGDAFLETISSLIPVMGEYITKFKMAFDAAVKIFSEEVVLREAGSKIREHTEIADSFIRVYMLATKTWIEGVLKVRQSQEQCMQGCLKFGLIPEKQAASPVQ
ncbi:MAG TPA: hypothetical protein VGI78_20925 [Acetobacteraceae bacterium]